MTPLDLLFWALALAAAVVLGAFAIAVVVALVRTLRPHSSSQPSRVPILNSKAVDGVE